MKYSFALLMCGLLSGASLIADEKPDRISIATWNVEWFFDHYKGDNRSDLAREQSAPSREEWEWKLGAVAGVIAEMRPTILALQEVENRHVVRQLTRRLSDQYELNYRIAFIQGWDNFTEQDVAVIYRSGLVEKSFREQSSEMFESKQYYNLNKHLFARFEWGDAGEKESLTILNVHLRAMPEKHDLREKQCRLIRQWLKIKIEAGENVVVVGDMNTEEQAAAVSSGSDMAILSGCGTQTTSDDLFDLHEVLNPSERPTYLTGSQFDRILASDSMMKDEKGKTDLVFSRIANYQRLVVVGTRDENHFNEFYNIPQPERDYSDHYPVMAEFLFK